MPTSDLELLVATMFPATRSYLRITQGFLGLTFRDGRYVCGGQFLMRVDSGPDTYSEAIAEFNAEGAYSTLSNTQLTFEAGTSTSRMDRCNAFEDGQLSEVPCDSMQAQGILPPSATPYRCSSDRLELDIPSPHGEIITMFFDRGSEATG